MSDWISFKDRLPTINDATGQGLVMIQGNHGERSGLWNWISPTTPHAAELWAVNGCYAWRRMRDDDPIYRP